MVNALPSCRNCAGCVGILERKIVVARFHSVVFTREEAIEKHYDSELDDALLAKQGLGHAEFFFGAHNAGRLTGQDCPVLGSSTHRN